jgi:predicted RNase H-like HicB family nuclease
VVSRWRCSTAWRPVKTSGYSGEEALEELEEALLGVAHAHLPTSDEALPNFRIGRAFKTPSLIGVCASMNRAWREIIEPRHESLDGEKIVMPAPEII